ncbi:hypothetical protein, partial [Prevotella sp. HJM029]|uniref:hypothetical protein n=1 Tax=Prevotella sp. HJM029 TaxID=1433844 RepID=UPI001C1073B1
KYNPDGVEENHMRRPYHITNGMRQSIRPNIPSVWIYWQTLRPTIPSDWKREQPLFSNIPSDWIYW